MNDNNLKYISRLIYKQITGSITEEEIQELQKWRRLSPKNEETYLRLIDVRFLEREYRRYKNVEHTRPLQDMKSRIQSERLPRQVRFWKFASAAAAALLLAVCGITLWNTSRDRPEIYETTENTSSQIPDIKAGKTQAILTLDNGSTISLGADQALNSQLIAQQQPSSKNEAKRINNLTTPRGSEFMIMLEDSTKVWLNAESQLIYPETFGGNERRVEIKGEAYFQVAKDKTRPFYVKSPGSVIRVYGTEFNINAYSEEKEVYTTLVSGRISLQHGSESKSELILTPGHQAIYNKDSRITSVKTVNTETITSWHNGRFVFEEQTLEQIMKTLARWYDFEYEFDNENIRKTVFKGSAPRYADLSEVLGILEKSGGLEFKAKNDKIIITTEY